MFQPDDVFEPYLEMNECSFVDKAADFYTEVFYLFLNWVMTVLLDTVISSITRCCKSISIFVQVATLAVTVVVVIVVVVVV